MQERNKKFSTIALQSSLFKGRADWYFCFLKLEKIAHVLVLLSERVDKEQLRALSVLASKLPSIMLHFAAGQINASLFLAELLSLISRIRLAATSRALSQENAIILIQELESVAERIASPNQPSPFISPEDLVVTEIAPIVKPSPLPTIKDITKGHYKGQDNGFENKGHNDRSAQILEFLRAEKRGVSIKEIAKVIKDCSEKTIQRELTGLIERNLVKREGDRRWSIYLSL